jgi:hypothetical protein
MKNNRDQHRHPLVTNVERKRNILCFLMKKETLRAFFLVLYHVMLLFKIRKLELFILLNTLLVAQGHDNAAFKQ